MLRSTALVLLLVLLCACPSRDRPRDASARPDVPPSPMHVCYGPGGSAVEVARAVACASLGGSDTAPMEVPRGPGVRRDGGALQPP